MPKPNWINDSGEPNNVPLTDEGKFLAWFKRNALMQGIDTGRRMNLNPDDPGQHYDLRASYLAGGNMDPNTLHWSSQFKPDSSPERFLPFQGSWQDTKYAPGQTVSPYVGAIQDALHGGQSTAMDIQKKANRELTPHEKRSLAAFLMQLFGAG